MRPLISLHGSRRFVRIGLLTVASSALLACATPVYRVQSQPDYQSPPQTQVYFYPRHGQSPERQDRDRYECHLWAVRESGFDPGLTPLAPHQRIEVVSRPEPGANVAAGAFGGALVGSLLAGPRQTGAGLVLGAATGAILGAAADASQRSHTEALQQHYDADYAARYAQAEHVAGNYRRAMAACLEGRGYSVD